MRQISGAVGYNTAPLVAHFGLGDATNVEVLRIEWPSGTVQEFHNVAGRQILTITEPARLIPTITNGVPQFYLRGGRDLQYDIQASTDLTNWTSLGKLTVTNLNGVAAITDPGPQNSSYRFYRAAGPLP